MRRPRRPSWSDFEGMICIGQGLAVCCPSSGKSKGKFRFVKGDWMRRTLKSHEALVVAFSMALLFSSSYGWAASRKAYVDFNGGTQLVQDTQGWRVIAVVISSRPGILKTGDLVVKIGDHATAGLSPISVFYLLRNSLDNNLPIIVRRDSHETELRWPAVHRPKPPISHAELLKRYGIGALVYVKPKEPHGFFIGGLLPKGPAARAGLRVGDQILAIDGHTVSGLSAVQVVRLLVSKSPGKVRFSIRRGDRELEMEVQRGPMSQILSPPRPPPLLRRGTPAPAFRLPDVEGKSHSLSDYRGRWVLLDFWGTWCAPCRAEIPDLEEAAHRFGPKLAILGLDVNDTPGALRTFLSKNKLPYHVLIAGDTGSPVPKAYLIQVYPTCVLVAPDGSVVYAGVGTGPGSWLAERMPHIVMGKGN